jgi:hypothetical protein
MANLHERTSAELRRHVPGFFILGDAKRAQVLKNFAYTSAYTKPKKQKGHSDEMA